MIQAETLNLLEWPRLCQQLATFAATKLGAIAAHRLQPPDSLAVSSTLLAQTREVVGLEIGLVGAWTFDGIEDIGDALERSDRGGMLSGKELLAIATTLAGVRRLRRAIDEREEEVPTLAALVASARTYPELEQDIHHCIDEQGNVTDRASSKLADLRHQIKQTRDRIYQTLQRLLQRYGNAVQQPTITQREGRFVIPVKAPQKDAIPGIVHDASSSGATLYVEPQAIVDSGNRLRQLQRRELVEVEAVLRALSEKVAAVREDLEALLAIATALDLATARARYSLWLEANEPHFIDCSAGETTTLRGLRHPLLVWQQRHEQGHPVVPTDVQVRSPIRVVAITGPNTGGKTVTLKTIGLAALMAKVGLFVPAREPVELPWFDRILADIGDEQSIEQSLSTFSGHVRRIARILDELHERDPDRPALVLLDEVGAGTDPAEGSALAIALLQYLAARVQLTIATTHYGELKALKYQDERFENASVEFDEATLSPTYRLLWGIPGRSNALTIAQRLGLDAAIVERARNQLGGLSQDVNKTIAGLEAQRRQQEDKAREAGDLLRQAERFYREVSDRAAALQAREDDLKRRQEQTVGEAIAEAKGEIARVIRQLQQGPQTAQNAQKASEAVAGVSERYRPERTKPVRKPSYKPQIGERVRVPRLNQTAEVLSQPDADGELTVRFGLMKMTVPLSDIESLDGKKAEMPAKATKFAAPVESPTAAKPLPTVRTERNTLDVRGSRVADAELAIDRALADQVTRSGALWIIHGKGTGRLRQGIQAYLQHHGLVKSYELAAQQDGGAGVTVAYLQ
ncbi:MutS2 family protein [Rubidibacter lacunae KORDI 51-2]|uniref:Endonuclease MutS2 n=1 Tax=Rubidibacter lacunae KORDI 51-2 TaxID=582515 RepID=U5DIP6_9CHRO|nr:endonuclease MutS2 [Rubidibacter lacunae]ERN41541.1 MutS2 family protein [Rubidibacter lacunae KORDI 51-2]